MSLLAKSVGFLSVTLGSLILAYSLFAIVLMIRILQSQGFDNAGEMFTSCLFYLGAGLGLIVGGRQLQKSSWRVGGALVALGIAVSIVCLIRFNF